MSLSYQILGKPFGDNALYVQVDPGEAIHRILFDCGEKCLDPLTDGTVQSIDHLCFSHFHLDHVAGFDRFLRLNYNREHNPVHIRGPRDTPTIIQHRLRGVTWDLLGEQPGEWIVSEVTDQAVRTFRFFPREAFAESHLTAEEPSGGLLFTHRDYRIEARIMDHRVPTLAYRLSEPNQYNIDAQALDALELSRGAWLEQVRDQSLNDRTSITVDGQTYPLGELRDRLLLEHPGESVAYATDLIYNQSRIDALIEMISGCDVFVCESTYSSEDAELAEKHYHLTAIQAARIAADAEVGKLILFHLSKRYMQDGAGKLLEEARTIFPETHLPEGWEVGMMKG